jgi:hypothetical protein
MPILRSAEVRVLPGKRQPWGESVRDLKKIVDKHGAALRVLQLQFGGHPGTALISSVAADWETLAARTQAVNGDPAFQAFLAKMAQTPGAPYAEPVEVRLAEDITSEVGGNSTPLEGAQVIQVVSMRVLPGRRAKQLDFIRQMRETRIGTDRTPANVMQLVAGEANVLFLVWGFKDLNAWAKERAAGQPKSAVEILQRVEADPKYPFVEPISMRVFSDITNAL